MNCPNCGTANEQGSVFCAECGTKLVQETVRVEVPVMPEPQPIPQPKPVADQPATPRIPPEYKPLSPWAYFGWSLLYSIPFVGFVLLIVMSFAPRNKNHKNFTRSYWCAVLVALCVLVLTVVMAVAMGVGLENIGYMLEDMF